MFGQHDHPLNILWAEKEKKRRIAYKIGMSAIMQHICMGALLFKKKTFKIPKIGQTTE